MKRTILLFFLFPLFVSAQKVDFLLPTYAKRHESPQQNIYNQLHPMPAGVVYVQHPDEGEPEMRQHFRLMKKLGFNCLKQIMPVPEWELEDIQLIALEEGIIPWWYGDGGWVPFTEPLLKKLKISTKESIEAIRNNPKMIAYQKQVMKERILRHKRDLKNNVVIPQGFQTAFDPTVGGRGLDLSEHGKTVFNEWARAHYVTIEKLNIAWTLHHHGTGTPFTSWEDFEKNLETNVTARNYKMKMDVFQFKAEHGAKIINQRAKAFHDYDRLEPFRGGGEMGLFLPAAYMGVDMDRIADAVKDYGSFYPSTHFSWHFDETDNEIVRPLYIQASIMNDFNKGGWTGGWESTGGPQQFDGGKGDSELNAYYVDGGTLLQLYLSQMAAGFKGFGVWCWSVRSAGKEGGEYGLLDRNNQPTDRAVRLGEMAKAMEKYRDEIWESHKEPAVGILLDWNNDAAWAAMSVRGRESFRMFPIESRIGVARALMNANIPYEFVTPNDLRNGLAKRYHTIYLPAMISLQQDVLKIIDTYVKEGGNVVLDLPGGKFDENTALLPTGTGSTFAKLFGASLDNYQFSGSNKTLSLQGKEWTGFVVDMTPTEAKIVDAYSTGKPAIIHNKFGKGTATLIGLDISHQCFKPGNTLAEKILLQNTLNAYAAPYTCDGALVYRLSSDHADHYFFINDGKAQTVKLKSTTVYKNPLDAITGERVSLDAIELKADDARWIRVEK